MPATIAEHIARAEEDIARSRSRHPGEPAFAALVQSALAHSITAVAILLLGQERPAVPGLPDGYKIDTRQADAGERKWGYVLSFPSGTTVTSRFMWKTSEMALAAGITGAQDRERHQHELASASAQEA